MSSKEPPLDEIQWKSPQTALEMQGIHSNSVLFYFAQSPFFDRTSNNAVLFSQAMFNPSMMHLIQTREAFEGRLKTMTGLEFIVAQEPAEMAPGTGTGVWVIRKQTRRIKQVGECEISVHSSYFVVGENIYMAPSLADVIASRTLSIVSSLNNFFSLASSLQNFSPALGHTYLPPCSKSSPSTTQNSTYRNTSKEDASLSDIPGINVAKYLNPTHNSRNDTDSILATRLFEESINIFLKYGDEYMDENPVTGEPGAFHLSSTGRKEKEKLILHSTNNGPLQQLKSLHLKSDFPSQSKEKRGDKAQKIAGGKPKRKKSRMVVTNVNSN